MTRVHYLFALGAAVAAACFVGMFVPAPAFAYGFGVGDMARPGPSQYALIAGLILPPLGLLIYALATLSFSRAGALIGVLAFLVAFPALAQTDIATVDGTSLKLSWEAIVAAFGPTIASFAVTILSGLASIILARVAPVWISTLVQSRLETTVQTAVDYALNATEGAAKGKTLTVPVGSAVIATTLQRIADSTAPWLIRRAKGGLPELANRAFRKLDLVPEATAANVVAPAIQNLPDLAARG